MPTLDDLAPFVQGGAGMAILGAAAWAVRLLHSTVLKAGDTRDAAAEHMVDFYRAAAADAERRADLAETRAELYLRRLINGNGKHDDPPETPPTE